LVVDGHDTHSAHAGTVSRVARRGNEARTPSYPRVRRWTVIGTLGYRAPRPYSVRDVLSGRRHECDAIDHLLAGLQDSRSGVLVVRGDPGVGRSALLGCALKRASGLRVVRAIGVDSEIELAFAGLHQLCAPLLDRRERLPKPQREALEIAFGLAAGAPQDRFLLGLSVLSLLAEAARERPLVLCVDDAQ